MQAQDLVLNYTYPQNYEDVNYEFFRDGVHHPGAEAGPTTTFLRRTPNVERRMDRG